MLYSLLASVLVLARHRSIVGESPLATRVIWVIGAGDQNDAFTTKWRRKSLCSNEPTWGPARSPLPQFVQLVVWHQLVERHFKGLGQSLNRVQTHVDATTLDVADVSAIHAALEAQCFLRHQRFTYLPKSVAKLNIDSLECHSAAKFRASQGHGLTALVCAGQIRQTLANIAYKIAKTSQFDFGRSIIYRLLGVAVTSSVVVVRLYPINADLPEMGIAVYRRNRFCMTVAQCASAVGNTLSDFRPIKEWQSGPRLEPRSTHITRRS